MKLLRCSLGISLLVLLILESRTGNAHQFEWEDEDTIIVEATREEDQENIVLGRTGYQQFYTKLSTNSFRSRQGRAFQGFVQTCYSVLGDQGHCATFRECFPMLYYTEGEHQGQIKHPVLADLLMSTSGPCVAAPFAFARREGRDDFVPFLESEEENVQDLNSRGGPSYLANAKDLICCPSDRPSPTPPVLRPPLKNTYPNKPTASAERLSMRTSTSTPAPPLYQSPDSKPHKSEETKDAVAALVNTVIKDSAGFGFDRFPNLPTRAPSTRATTRVPATRAPTRAPATRATTRTPTTRATTRITTTTTTARPIEDDEDESEESAPFNVIIPSKEKENPKKPVDMNVPIDFGPGEVGIIVDALPDPAEVEKEKPIEPEVEKEVEKVVEKEVDKDVAVFPTPITAAPAIVTEPPITSPPDVSANIDYSKPQPKPYKPKGTQRTTRAPFATKRTTTTTTTTTKRSVPEDSESEEDYEGDSLGQSIGVSIQVPDQMVPQPVTTTTTTVPTTTTTTAATTTTTAATTTTTSTTRTTPATSNPTSKVEIISSVTTKKPKLPESTRSPCGRLNSTSDPQYPWVAAIKLGPRFICAGSIIDEYHIVTAAHCLSSLSTMDIGRLRVYLGERILNSNEDGPTIIRKVSRAMRHRGFSISTLRNDIALLKLSLPIPVGTKRVRPICLPLDSDQNLMLETSSEASIVGWAPNWNEVAHDSIHDNKYKVYMDDGCLEKYRNFMPHIQIEDSMLCANLDYSPKGLSQLSDIGNDGSPVIVKDRHGIYQQIGISSWRLGPSPVYPRVLTRVASFQSWLQKNRVRP